MSCQSSILVSPPATQTVVLVDDDPAVRKALRFSLETEGFAVDTYDSGEALAAQSALPENACFVLDYRLPDMDGLALLRTLRSREAAQRALLITTNPTPKLRREAADAGVEIVEKPLLSDALSTSLRRLFGARRAH